MLHVDLPTRPEIRALAEARDPLSVSLYLPTSTVSQDAAERDRILLKNLAAEARDQLEEKRKLFEARRDQGRATTDVAQAARAAVFGAVDTLLVDIDAVVPGWLDDEDGSVRFAAADDAHSYGLVDQIAARALAGGARVLGVRAGDLPDGAPLAAILRYPV